MKYTTLIVDDNPKIFHSLRENFADFGVDCLWAENGAGTVLAMSGGRVDVVLLDLSLGAENGLDILARLRKSHPGTPVVMITGFGTLEAAVKAIKLGAYDFLAKPLDFDKLRAVVEQAVAFARPDPGREAAADRDSPDLVSRCPKVLAVSRKAKMLATTDLSVLIGGESGCGKELLADLVHRHSKRAERPFLKVNCSAFPDTLMDNELFGHEKGAFTGADSAHIGLFEQADGGTLLLDEIGDMSLGSQTKLLRVLEDGRVRRLGGREERKVDVRILASTNRDLSALIGERRFREDLFYRLNPAFLLLPPLRDRAGDVPLLLAHFLARHSEGGETRRFSPAAEAILAAYAWPGNVRELKNLVRLCSALATGEVIEASDLPGNVVAASGGGRGDRDEAPSAGAATLGDMEKEMILKTLEETRYNKRRTSQRLGISYKTLFNKMKHHGIQ